MLPSCLHRIRTRVPALSYAQRHFSVKGCAVPAKLAAYAAKFGDVMCYRLNQRSGLLFPVVSYGTEEWRGDAPGDRAALLRSVSSRGVNTFFIDLDAVLERRGEGRAGERREERGGEGSDGKGKIRSWEAESLLWTLRNGRLDREEMTVIVKVGYAGVMLPDGTTSTLTRNGLHSKIRAGLDVLGLEMADVVMITIPSDEAALGGDTSQTLVHAANDLVHAGVTQYYGFTCEGWTPLPSHTKFGRPLKPLLQQVESTVTSTWSHKLVALGFTANLGQPSTYLPLAVDASGAEWSAVQLMADYGVSAFIRNPFDAVVGAKPFHCINSPHHREHHPRRTTALFNDVLNFAIHCEVLWEKQVKAVAFAAANKRTVVSGVSNDEDAGILPPQLGASDLLPTDVAWARIIADNINKFTYLEWHQVLRRRIRPAIRRLREVLEDVEEAREWLRGYTTVLQDVLQKVTLLQEQQHAFQADVLASRLDASVPALAATQPLHTKIERILLSAPSTVLFTEAPEAFSVKRNKRLRMALPINNSQTSKTAENTLDTQRAPIMTQQFLTGLPFEAVRASIPIWATALSAAAAATVPPLPDQMEGVPTQAELEPVQAAMRRMKARLPPAN